MYKRTLGLIAATVFASGAMATTPTDTELAAANGIECYPLAHGENGLGSRSEVYIPPFTTSGSWWVQYAVANVGGDTVNVTLKLFDENGNPYDSTSGVTYDANFSSSNTPLRQIGGTNSAILSSFNVGQIKIDNNSSSYFSGVLSWQADKCITKPALLIDGAHYIRTGGPTNEFGLRTFEINGGKPF